MPVVYSCGPTMNATPSPLCARSFLFLMSVEAAAAAASAPPPSSSPSSSSASSLPPSLPSAPSELASTLTAFGVLLEREGEEVESVSRLVRDVHRLNRSVASSLQSLHTAGCASDAALAAVALAALSETAHGGADVRSHVGRPPRVAVAALPHAPLLAAGRAAVRTAQLPGGVVRHAEAAEQGRVRGAPRAGRSDVRRRRLPAGRGRGSPRSSCAWRSTQCARGNPALVHPISAFLHDLYAGLRLLNLRNDALRRRVDGVKYDVLKIEEIMYDLAVRQGQARAARPPHEGSTGEDIGAAARRVRLPLALLA